LSTPRKPWVATVRTLRWKQRVAKQKGFCLIAVISHCRKRLQALQRYARQTASQQSKTGTASQDQDALAQMNLAREKSRPKKRMMKPSKHILRLPIEKRAEIALKIAVAKAIDQDVSLGLPVYIWHKRESC
jgi:hypothetical protein